MWHHNSGDTVARCPGLGANFMIESSSNHSFVQKPECHITMSLVWWLQFWYHIRDITLWHHCWGWLAAGRSPQNPGIPHLTWGLGALFKRLPCLPTQVPAAAGFLLWAVSRCSLLSSQSSFWAWKPLRLQLTLWPFLLSSQPLIRLLTLVMPSQSCSPSKSLLEQSSVEVRHPPPMWL